MIIIGIDPGSRITGYGVIESQNGKIKHLSHGVIKADVNAGFATRMLQIGKGLTQIFSLYKADHVVIEKIFLGKSADSAFKLGHARGVSMFHAAQAGAQVIEYTTREVKKGITGQGSAEKEHVQAVLQAMLGIPKIEKIDASDALALACFHSIQLEVAARFGQLQL